jgi:BRCT domain type II-containing protein
MLTKTVLAFCVLCAFVLIGCTKTETTSNSNSTTTNSNKSTTTTTTTGTTSSTGDKIGVPECDDYIAKYEACVNGKVPEMARAQFNSSMKNLRDAWRKAAATPEGKAGLAAGCKQATEQAKTSMKAYGCEF